ncbi:pyroglutamylated RF-amide peptide receptor [Nematostella vectensis]|uniref:pyroglutamylated RF-amide peptide receptor n=1 Tax=Nematostella vectensis TaxID=45351 RepID=UPI00207724DB|nr:pyroglutamylated RF-amide peptide receptor [Nematostella vectensis]XP_032242823.2 pyroglutamylated RF-amide peptide receptor [Nematostella vectensis]XP_032242824.2 pyroglutamylated RF-amide peptide receptor [Nematostella vectensis]XP_048580938.1 pyroglutamylated RF-amide peptide receptor [Nematostella vectensis]XP_048580939.1 pyroglutamylated RF-amide peptide receptor [Nematostella vectensis]
MAFTANETLENQTVSTLAIWSTSGGEFIASLLILGAVSLIGLAGNGLVVFVIYSARSRGQKSAVQLFLLHLAVSDLMVCLLCVPLTIFVNFSYSEHHSSSDDVTCKVARFIQFLAPTSSICILTAISIDRFYSLVKPLKRKSLLTRPFSLLLSAWVYAGVLFLPTFYFTKVEQLLTNKGKVWYCATIPNNVTSGVIYLLFLSVTAFVIPLVTMIVLYVRVGKTVWSRQRKISLSSNTYITRKSINAMEKSKRRVTRMLLIVVVIFLVCWAPFTIYTGFIERWVASFPNPADGPRLVLYGIGLFNSICNPFIYYFSSGEVRKASMKFICLETSVAQRSRAGSADIIAPSMRINKGFVPGGSTLVSFDGFGNECYDTQL